MNYAPDDPDEGGAREERGRRGIRALFVDLTPLTASPAFARLWVGTSVAQIGAQITIVAVSLHIYEITHSTLAVSFVALWALGPMILAGFVGGALADAFDRRTVALVTTIAAWCSTGTLSMIAFLGVETTWPYYALAAVNAASATIKGAAQGAILPRLLPAQLLPAAAALGGITMGLSVTVGPAVAGVLVASVGFAWTYLLDVVLFTGAFLGIMSLPRIAPDGGGRRGMGVGSVVDSMRFLRHAPNVRATFVWDLIAMILGQPRVVFPAAGAIVLGGGPVTVGILTASFAVGALLSGLVSGPLGAVRRQGRAVTLAVAAFGICTALFGVVLLLASLGVDERLLATVADDDSFIPANPLAIALAGLALAAAGAADNVSAVFRTTILQAAAPDGVRGRMQGLFYVVVAGGPRVGDLVAGGLATLFALWASPLIGGVLIFGIMLVLLRTARGFQSYDALRPAP